MTQVTETRNPILGQAGVSRGCEEARGNRDVSLAGIPVSLQHEQDTWTIEANRIGQGCVTSPPFPPLQCSFWLSDSDTIVTPGKLLRLAPRTGFRRLSCSESLCYHRKGQWEATAPLQWPVPGSHRRPETHSTPFTGPLRLPSAGVRCIPQRHPKSPSAAIEAQEICG